MNGSTVRVLFVHEVRTLLRDRRAVFLSIVLPMLVTPLILLSAKFTRERRERALEATTYRYAVAGAWAEEARRVLEEARRLEKGSGLRLEEVRVADPAASLRAKDLHVYLEALTGAEADALERAQVPRKPRAPDEGGRLPGVPVVKIYYQADRDASQAGRSRVRELLERARRARADTALRERGFPLEPSRVFEVGERNVATAAEVTGSTVGRFLTLLLIMLMLTGGATAAMDIIAGEKERGTLETLLTTAARRAEIVAAKQLVILAVALLITFIQVANILVYVTLRVIELPRDFVLEAPPATILALLLLFVPLAALVSAVLLMISGYARSYKEAQLYFFPVYLLSLVPSLAATLPGIRLRSAIVLVPLANVSVAVREVMVGRYDWPMILAAAAVVGLAAAGMVRASARMLSNERLISASPVLGVEEAGGPALFPRRALLWYAVMWVLILLGPGVLGLTSLKGQLLFNQLVVFLALPLLMIRRYRLKAREALALRGVKSVAWLAVVLAVPAAHLISIGVFRLANRVVPVPREALEQFGRLLLPPELPAWQLVLFVAVLPGVCEEIAFRGTLLYGLRRRLHPLALALATGAIFGLFHAELFRILPTAFLGAVLTAVALLTGSILPGMLAHAANNGFALWAAREGLPLAALEVWVYLAAAAVFALCLYLLYRNRTPYPGLRPWSRSATTGRRGT